MAYPVLSGQKLACTVVADDLSCVADARSRQAGGEVAVFGVQALNGVWRQSSPRAVIIEESRQPTRSLLHRS